MHAGPKIEGATRITADAPLRSAPGDLDIFANLLRLLLLRSRSLGLRLRRTWLGGRGRLGHHHCGKEHHRHLLNSPNSLSGPQSREISMGQQLTLVGSQGVLAGPTKARITPRTAFTSREDQPVLVKMVRSVFWVARVRDGG